MKQIDRLAISEWKRLREIRSRALLDSPDAFGTTIEEHEAQNADVWKRWISSPSGAVFIAQRNDADVGIAMSAPYLDRDGAAGLFGMWIAPEARGVGLAAKLIYAIIEWARDSDCARLLLDVGDENDAAIRLYQRCGFVPTGRRSTHPAPRTHLKEHELELVL